MFYDITLAKDDNGTWLVSVPALPHVHTFGKTKAEARTRAVDAILTGLDMLVAQKKRIPKPAESPKGKESARLPALVAAKVEIHNAMLERGIGKYRLGQLLDWHSPQVDRLVNFRHASKLDQLEQALAVLGRRLVVRSAADVGAA